MWSAGWLLSRDFGVFHLWFHWRRVRRRCRGRRACRTAVRCRWSAESSVASHNNGEWTRWACLSFSAAVQLGHGDTLHADWRPRTVGWMDGVEWVCVWILVVLSARAPPVLWCRRAPVINRRAAKSGLARAPRRPWRRRPRSICCAGCLARGGGDTPRHHPSNWRFLLTYWLIAMVNK